MNSEKSLSLKKLTKLLGLLQERSHSIETESTCSTSSESRRKLIEERRQSNSDISSNSYDEIIDSQRKNTKNVINARLNNRGNLEDKPKAIKRIDLRAYGFENEFPSKNGENHFSKSKSNRVINKLDLRSFGYDSGLRRTQSINNIDARFTDHLTFRKSNLVEQGCPKLTRDSSHEILTKSTENLSDDAATNFHDFAKITSAKSVPNIDQISSRFHDDRPRYNSHGKSANFAHENSDGNGKYENSLCHEEVKPINRGSDEHVGKKSSLPSVKRLAQAFNKPEEIKPIRRVS